MFIRFTLLVQGPLGGVFLTIRQVVLDAFHCTDNKSIFRVICREAKECWGLARHDAGYVRFGQRPPHDRLNYYAALLVI